MRIIEIYEIHDAPTSTTVVPKPKSNLIISEESLPKSGISGTEPEILVGTSLVIFILVSFLYVYELRKGKN